MKRVILVFSVAFLVLFSASAGKPDDNRASQFQAHRDGPLERTVFVTGSLIPQRVHLRPIGTATVSPVRIIGRGEIDNSGRFTTPGTFINEPSVRIIGH